MMTDLHLRPGHVVDIPVLDAIAFESKAHWGYAPEQLAAWRDDLSLQADALPVRPVCVAELDGQPIGYAQVATDTLPWELWAMWVRPAHMRRGVGRALLAWARQLSAAAGQPELAIDADPHAARFYMACGAVEVGRVAAPIAGDLARVRPQLRLATAMH